MRNIFCFIALMASLLLAGTAQATIYNVEGVVSFNDDEFFKIIEPCDPYTATIDTNPGGNAFWTMSFFFPGDGPGFGGSFAFFTDDTVGSIYEQNGFLSLYGATAFNNDRLFVTANMITGKGSWTYDFAGGGRISGTIGDLCCEPAPIPVPGAALLLGPGLAGLVALRRRLA